jgi:2'-5' RNA ligase
MKGQSILYFIAIIPPEYVCEEIIVFKKDIAERFESKAALKVVPHITLKAPFKLSGSEQERLLSWFRKLKMESGQLKVSLQDFGAFPKAQAPVIFIAPVLNAALQELQKEFIGKFKKEFSGQEISKHEEEFHPHVTIAYRDLTPEKFREAWKEYQVKKYSAEFTVTSVHLLQHDGKQWHILETRSLRESP